MQQKIGWSAGHRVSLSILGLVSIFTYFVPHMNAAAAAFVPPVLTYDDPVVQLAPGQSVDIGATLNVGSAGLMTDQDGTEFVSVPGFVTYFGTLNFIQPLDLNGFFAGTPAYLFAIHTSFVPGDHSQLENLNLAPGSCCIWTWDSSLLIMRCPRAIMPPMSASMKAAQAASFATILLSTRHTSPMRARWR